MSNPLLRRYYNQHSDVRVQDRAELILSRVSDTFETKEFTDEADKFAISKRTCERYLRILEQDHRIERVQHGKFIKLAIEAS